MPSGWLKIDWLELVSQAASFTSGEKWVSLAAEKLGSMGGVSQVSVTQALVKTFPGLKPFQVPGAAPVKYTRVCRPGERLGNPSADEQCVCSLDHFLLDKTGEGLAGIQQGPQAPVSREAGFWVDQML